MRAQLFGYAGKAKTFSKLEIIRDMGIYLITLFSCVGTRSNELNK